MKEEQNSIKSILCSRTIWVNILAIIFVVIQTKFGFVVDETTQVYILTGINLVLRMITKTEIVWETPKKVLSHSIPKEPV